MKLFQLVIQLRTLHINYQNEFWFRTYVLLIENWVFLVVFDKIPGIIRWYISKIRQKLKYLKNGIVIYGYGNTQIMFCIQIHLTDEHLRDFLFEVLETIISQSQKQQN